MRSDNEEIVKIIDDFDRDTKALKKELFSLTWYMRGGISYEDAMTLSYHERELIGEIVKSNLETTEKSGLPFF